MLVEYLRMGFSHVIPMGADHILFMMCLVLQNKKLSSIVYKSLIFTLSHSLALLLAVEFHLPNYSLTEPLIALTIFISAIGILFNQTHSKLNVVLIFGFGIIHGLGFANAFMEAGIESLVLTVLSFNVGVELAQVCILLAGFILFHAWLGKWQRYKKWIENPACTLIACISIYWFIMRLNLFN